MTTVSIICPTYNEEKYIAQTLESLSAQQHEGFALEVLICDGRSTDKTRDIVRQFSLTNPEIKLIDNPDRKTPYAFNAGLKAAKGEYVAILGAHTKYDPDYVQACLEALISSGSVGCTGRVITKSAFDTLEAKLCEWVMLSSFGVSRSSFRTMQEGYVESVNFPVFKKQALLDLGGYDITLERNQDNDMNQRLLDAGHKLYCTWKTKCFYRPPATLNKLLSYAYRNGFWNAISLKKHPGSMRLHHIIPFLFSAGLMVGAILGFFEFVFLKTYFAWLITLGVIFLHLVAGILATARSMKYKVDAGKVYLPFIFFAFHFMYGWGTLNGIIKGKA